VAGAGQEERRPAARDRTELIEPEAEGVVRNGNAKLVLYLPPGLAEVIERMGTTPLNFVLLIVSVAAPGVRSGRS
jgi:hypothetical protein